MKMRLIVFFGLSIGALLGVAGISSHSTIVEAQTRTVLRCGWFSNPTPANAWLIDRDGEWTIGIQGGYQAEGEMPDFGANWVETNVHYGYGCACMSMRVDQAKKRVIEYRKVQVLPLSRCKKDGKLPPR